MAVLRGSWPFDGSLRRVVVDLPFFAGFNFRLEPWHTGGVIWSWSRRLCLPLELSPGFRPLVSSLDGRINEGFGRSAANTSSKGGA